MALIHDIARLAHSGVPRADIAASLLIDRQILDWLMDSDSFAVVMEGACSEGGGKLPQDHQSEAV